MNVNRSLKLTLLATLIGASTLLGGCATSQARDEAATQTYSFPLTSPVLEHLYPNAADPTMPAYYHNQDSGPIPFPQTLADSIKVYTNESLKNDGITDATTEVTTSGNSATLTITSADPAVSGYGAMIQSMLDAGAKGWQGALDCQQAQGCWDPHPGNSPWAFYMPWGLPLVNQDAVILLDYPPSDSLCTSDYLNNFTMIRWGEVLKSVGIQNPALYETIVDAHPIAAPGSGQSDYIPNTTQYFAGPDGFDIDMLNAVTVPPSTAGAATTLPVMVSGSPARKVWAQLIGQSYVDVGEVGNSTLPGATKPTPWIGANHPTVTTYQCCPGDTTCWSDKYGKSDKLVENEVTDLVTACTLQEMVTKPGITIEKAQEACQSVWSTSGPAQFQQAICVRARLDYNYKSDGHCNCQQAAEAFCAANANNACPASGAEGDYGSCKAYNDKYCPGGSFPKYPRCEQPS